MPDSEDDFVEIPIDLGFQADEPCVGWVKIRRKFLSRFPEMTISPAISNGEAIGFGLVSTRSYVLALQKFKS